jgi:hypothetical protein
MEVFKRTHSVNNRIVENAGFAAIFNGASYSDETRLNASFCG